MSQCFIWFNMSQCLFIIGVRIDGQNNSVYWVELNVEYYINSKSSCDLMVFDISMAFFRFLSFTARFCFDSKLSSFRMLVKFWIK